MSFGGIAVGLTVVSGVMGKRNADKSAKKQAEAGKYNSAALIANGKISGAVTKFDAIGPSFQARLDAENSRTNETIYRFNADITRKQGKIAAGEYTLRAKEILADSAREGENTASDAYDAAKEKRAGNNQFQRDLNDIDDQSARKRALTKAAYAATGASMDSGVIRAIEEESSRDTEKEIAHTMLARTIENKSTGKLLKSARRKQEDLKRESKRAATTLDQSAKLTELETERNASTAEREADNMAASGEYMDWYADFITESADLKAQVLATGAQISADQTFSTSQANASATRRSGTAALVGAVGSAATQGFSLASAP
tara:strand:+ start:1 stop:951 length:951 start_codon:yes stop_codon:yes gene_type:complete